MAKFPIKLQRHSADTALQDAAVSACAAGREADADELNAPSLRRGLLWLIVLVVLVAASVQAMAVYRVALSETEAVFDSQMQRMALSLSGGLATAVFDDSEVPEGQRAQDWIVQIWRADGTMLYRSASARLLPQQTVLGFSDVRAHNQRFRVYALQTPLQVIQVAQTELSRRELASKLALRTMAPVALLMPLCLLLVWWGIARAFAPLERARASLAKRSLADLSPLPRDGLPTEVQPLLREVNGLLTRLDLAWCTQQHFVADAAHELRSPLAALRLQAQSLQRAQAPEQRELAMLRLIAGIDRATRMVEQLLTLARQEGAHISPVAQTPFDATATCQRALADLEPLAKARGIALQAEALDAVQLVGHVEGFASLVRNLLENALRYTPEGGEVRLMLRQGAPLADAAGAAPTAATAKGVTLSVEDSGPGIAPEERERVFDRFYRVPGSAPGGTGLGLAIVKAIADGFGAQVRLGQSPALGGLQVQVAFPL
ncbi:hypothetical protein CCO03_07890 [Comamonas serinivorans]|uniref:histidine kinase n=1 Tax=Comamonas serinivorans TaxID=1082851 RepID=A0A1Y0ELT8_9BURK|nr:ATP-binding protein [Comamonas serinivorans]ARU04603.1 hypothetical protein CCO03_07890 [Comamonas serinivorans]